MMSVRTRRAGAAALLMAVAGMTACGGAAEDTTRLSASQRPALLGATEIIAPLVADDGSPWPTAGAPADPAARSRTGRYASAAQAEQLAQGSGLRAIRIVVPDGSAEGVEAAITQVMQAVEVGADDESLGWLLQGPDARALAVVADRLADLGQQRVWVVRS
jgi:hypothetical protein